MTSEEFYTIQFYTILYNYTIQFIQLIKKIEKERKNRTIRLIKIRNRQMLREKKRDESIKIGNESRANNF